MQQNLLPLLERAHVPLSSCFFTNFFMGLRCQGKRNDGTNPGASDQGFVRQCEDFLLLQLALLRPRVVLALGRQVLPHVARLSQELTEWQTVRGQVRPWKDIDHRGPVRHPVNFRSEDTPACNIPACTIVALTHPSMRWSNVHRRRYCTRAGHALEGDAAEIEMIREAIRESGFAP